LEAGIDALIAAGKQVKVTAHSKHGDANSILETEGLGEKELSRLIACAGSAALSFEGEVAELSKLPVTEYMKARREVARF
jgi:phosphoribosylcarboxyaminoimidazole (NCAIR) mutase